MPRSRRTSGVLADTVGRFLSVVTVNDHEAPANAFPARSWMPVPADTVKWWPGARSEAGRRLARWVPAS